MMSAHKSFLLKDPKNVRYLYNDGTSPENFIPLHELCGRCKAFGEKIWEKELETKWPSEIELDWGPPHFHDWPSDISLGRVEDLTPATCHFCAIIDAFQRTAMSYNEIPYPGDQFGGLVRPSPDCIIVLRGTPGRSDSKPQRYSITILGEPRCLQRVWDVGYLQLASFSTHNANLHESLVTEKVPNPRATDLKQARSWLEHCLSEHHLCNHTIMDQSIHQIEQPKRLVQIAADRIRVKDIEHDTAAGQFNYITLSHMWGVNAEAQLRLTKSSFQEFQERIPDARLSSLFRQAIRITQCLGFEYIWIDSLCIIQDCPTDWESEASRMAAIYSNGVCNIAFLYPPEEHGVPNTDDPRVEHPCILRQPDDTRYGVYISPRPPLSFSRLDEETATSGTLWNWISPSTWPLSTRAWIFQEILLCKRNLFCGRNAFLWECAENYIAQTVGPVRAPQYICDPDVGRQIRLAYVLSKRDFRARERTLFGMFLDQAEPDQNGVRAWNMYIHLYRQRRISHVGDRTMALAGVARVFGVTHGLIYLAGHFLEHMPRALLWQRSNFCRTKELFLTSRVPSWSWLSLPIYHEESHYWSNEDTALTFGKDFEGDFDRDYHGTRHIYFATVVSFQWPELPMKHLPDNSFYEFQGVSLILEAPVFSAKIGAWNWYASEANVTCEQLRPLHGAGPGEDLSHIRGLKCVPDIVESNEERLMSPSDVSLILLEERLDSKGHFHSYGLIVVSNDDSTWKRVGYWELDQTIPTRPGTVSRTETEARDHFKAVTKSLMRIIKLV